MISSLWLEYVSLVAALAIAVGEAAANTRERKMDRVTTLAFSFLFIFFSFLLILGAVRRSRDDKADICFVEKLYHIYELSATKKRWQISKILPEFKEFYHHGLCFLPIEANIDFEYLY
jgi:hypothetical protein